ncbi:MAG: type II secretion system protein [Phycisphaerales bacterium]
MSTCCQCQATPPARCVCGAPPPARHKGGFTLIELLVVIAVIALLVGILLPALANARKTAKAIKCGSGLKGHGLSFALYANEYKGWFPIIPFRAQQYNDYFLRDRYEAFLGDQFIYGGVAGLYSLFQNPDGGEAPATGNYGFVGSTGNYDRSNPPGYVRSRPVGGVTVAEPAITSPLMRNYQTSLASLTCPLHQLDTYYKGSVAQRRTADTNLENYAGLRDAPGTTYELIRPTAPSDEFRVARYNISYLYIAGLKSDEPIVLKPAPIFGDETRGLDLSTRAWYSSDKDRSLPEIRQGFQAAWDAHGTDGAQYAFTDGHVELIKFSVLDTFFARPEFAGGKLVRPVPTQSINALTTGVVGQGLPLRSNKVQTID